MKDPEYVYIWRYKVGPEQRASFERLYGPDGDWVRLFRRSPDWISTELLADLDRAGWYVTVDRWRSRAAYDAYRLSVAEAWDQIDRRGEGLTRREEQVTRLESVVLLTSPPRRVGTPHRPGAPDR